MGEFVFKWLLCPYPGASHAIIFLLEEALFNCLIQLPEPEPMPCKSTWVVALKSNGVADARNETTPCRVALTCAGWPLSSEIKSLMMNAMGDAVEGCLRVLGVMLAPNFS